MIEQEEHWTSGAKEVELKEQRSMSNMRNTLGRVRGVEQVKQEECKSTSTKLTNQAHYAKQERK
jgi:hypothetical protein